MHHLYLVVKKYHHEDKDAAFVESGVEDFLNESGFVQSGDGWWNSGGKCDWYSIGGRWAHVMQRFSVTKEVWDKFMEEEDALNKKHSDAWHDSVKKVGAPSAEWNKTYPKLEKKRKADENALWEKHFNVLPPTTVRMTQAQAERLFEEYGKSDEWGPVEVFTIDANWNGEGEDALPDMTVEDFVGNWVTIIDYHD